mgnify:CR=1 FL=1
MTRERQNLSSAARRQDRHRQKRLHRDNERVYRVAPGDGLWSSLAAFAQHSSRTLKECYVAAIEEILEAENIRSKVQAGKTEIESSNFWPKTQTLGKRKELILPKELSVRTFVQCKVNIGSFSRDELIRAAIFFFLKERHWFRQNQD